MHSTKGNIGNYFAGNNKENFEQILLFSLRKCNYILPYSNYYGATNIDIPSIILFTD